MRIYFACVFIVKRSAFLSWISRKGRIMKYIFKIWFKTARIKELNMYFEHSRQEMFIVYMLIINIWSYRSTWLHSRWPTVTMWSVCLSSAASGVLVISWSDLLRVIILLVCLHIPNIVVTWHGTIDRKRKRTSAHNHGVGITPLYWWLHGTHSAVLGNNVIAPASFGRLRDMCRTYCANSKWRHKEEGDWRRPGAGSGILTRV